MRPAAQAWAEAEAPASAGPAGGRLNEFQRTMLQWSGLHPYNAVHVAKVAFPVKADEFAAAAAAVLREAGLTNYSLDRGGARYRYGGGEASCSVETVASGSDPLSAVHGEIGRQLDLPFGFSEGLFQPFRFFLVDGGDEGEVGYVGLAYFHVVADADAIARLLAEILGRLREGGPGPLRDEGLRLRAGMRPPMGQPLLLPRRLLGAFRKFQAMRRSHRSPACPVEGGYGNRWFARALDATATDAVLARARERAATFNDLCLAALLLAAAPATEERHGQRRRELSAGCVVNLRGELPERRRQGFGLALGSFSVTHPVPPGIGLDALLADLRAQTAVVKRDKLYLASSLEYRLNRLLLARQRPEKRSNFYRKAFPVWGSITNFKMNLGEAGERAGIIDYLRAVSAGPALPYVASVTGFGGRLNFGFTYRPELVDEPTVAGIADRFLELLAGKEVAA
jgi:hypothetical protein